MVYMGGGGYALSRTYVPTALISGNRRDLPRYPTLSGCPSSLEDVNLEGCETALDLNTYTDTQRPEHDEQRKYVGARFSCHVMSCHSTRILSIPHKTYNTYNSSVHSSKK